MLRTLGWLLLLFLAAAGIWLLFFLNAAGVFLSIETKAVGVCTPVNGGVSWVLKTLPSMGKLGLPTSRATTDGHYSPGKKSVERFGLTR